jgi:RNA polymerase sigma-70 factor (ECF subfamily)
MREQTADAGTIASEFDEAALAELAKARSPLAWTEIYSTHYPAIFRYIKARVFSQTTAEDLASAVFVGALKGIDSYQYRGQPLLAWLYRIARNVVASHQRQILEHRVERLDMRRRVLWHIMRLSGRGDAHGGDSGPVSVAASEDDPAMMVDRMDLHNALAKLPASQREVVILRFMVGLSAQEVGEVVGKRPAAVYSLQARAIGALREQLK